MNAQSIITTKNAGKLMRWTIGHFKLKVPAHYDATYGSVEFQFGTCNMEATSDELIVTVQAEDTKSLTLVKNIVGDMLKSSGLKNT